MKGSADDELTTPSRRQAMRVARMIGCSGAHQHPDGTWMPCSTHEQMVERIGRTDDSKGLKKRRKRRGRNNPAPDGWEDLMEGPILGIDTLPGGGLVSAKSARKARSDRLAATPAPPKDRIRGSSKNPSGTASSVSAGKDINIDEATLVSLRTKVREHNKSVDGQEPWKRTNLGALKSVYRRGAGAFSVSHRPGMTRNQWAMGRVNAFLKILKSGRPANRRYVGDNDLLHSDHPWRKQTKGKSLSTVRRFVSYPGLPDFEIEHSGETPFKEKAARFDRFARDGDLDGSIQDGTKYERRSRTLSHRAIGRRRDAELRRRYLRLRDLPDPSAVPEEFLTEEEPPKPKLPRK